MDINSAFPSKYLKASDLQGRDFNLSIDHVSMEDVGDGETKPVVYFGGAQKGLVLNRTNADAITLMHGPETDHWQGKPVTLTTAWVAFQGRNVQAIRVKIMQVPAQSTAMPAQSAAVNAPPNGGGMQVLGNPAPVPPAGQTDASTPFNDDPPF